MPLPPDLLLAATEGQGRVVFVMGAGCSVEPPTSLPLAHICSRNAYRRLVDDGVIRDSDCADPGNLEAVADVVVEKTQSKAALVSRLPRQQFRLASPNRGHDVLAALMGERVIRAALTTNFDLAINNALAKVGVPGVTVIDGQKDHRDLGNTSVIYLHRSANAPDEEWILTSAEVQEGWDHAWNTIVANTVLAAPAVVFIGMGTLVGVLLDNIRRVRTAIPDADSVFQVDPSRPEDSDTFNVLQPKESNYIQATWISFATELGDRVNRDHITQLAAACEALASVNNWGDIDVQPVMDCLAAAGLLEFGSARARWFLEDCEYLSWHTIEATWIAELAIVLAITRLVLAADITLSKDGTVRFSKDGREIGALGYLHAKASKRWGHLISESSVRRSQMDGQQESADAFVVAGIEGPQPSQISTPPDIVAQPDAVDVVAPTATPIWVSVDKLREEPHLLRQVFR